MRFTINSVLALWYIFVTEFFFLSIYEINVIINDELILMKYEIDFYFYYFIIYSLHLLFTSINDTLLSLPRSPPVTQPPLSRPQDSLGLPVEGPLASYPPGISLLGPLANPWLLGGTLGSRYNLSGPMGHGSALHPRHPPCPAVSFCLHGSSPRRLQHL